jgi:hypothetical protein
MLIAHHLQAQGRLLNHEVQVLAGDAALQLFRQAASLPGGPAAALQELEAAIVKACDGLPLALKLVGGLLRGKVAWIYWQVRLLFGFSRLRGFAQLYCRACACCCNQPHRFFILSVSLSNTSKLQLQSTSLSDVAQHDSSIVEVVRYYRLHCRWGRMPRRRSNEHLSPSPPLLWQLEGAWPSLHLFVQRTPT